MQDVLHQLVNDPFEGFTQQEYRLQITDSAEDSELSVPPLPKIPTSVRTFRQFMSRFTIISYPYTFLE
jgi:hypothetical protein